MSELLTAAEVAAELHISTRKVYAAAAAGDLGCHRFGAAVRFDPIDVEAWKKKCRSPATTPASGSSSLIASSMDAGSALTSYFRKARPNRKPTTTTGEKSRASGRLQLVESATSR